MASLDEIRQLFFVECEEQLEQITDGLGVIEALAPGDGPDPEAINTMFRAAHSMKGGAASFSLEAITRFAHAFESVLDEVRGGKLSLSPELIRAFYGASDYLAELVALGAAGEEPDAASLADHISAIASHSVAAEPASIIEDETAMEEGGDILAEFTPLALDFSFEPPFAAPSGFTIAFRPTAALFSNGHEPAHLFRELEALGTLTVEACLDEAVEWNAPMPAIAWLLSLVTECDESVIREIFEFAEPFADLMITPMADEPVVVPDADTEPNPDGASVAEPASALPTEERAAPAIAPEAPVPASPVPPTDPVPSDKAKAASKATVRVDLELVDNLINMVGELVITQSVMSQSIADAGIVGGDRLATTLEEFKSLTRQIQEGTMAIRAQSVKPLFQRMGRIARETAQIAAKDVRFVTEGDDTEVDRTVIERLVDPLTHILRNAIDHGLENVERRLAAGKEPTGTVTLSAAHRSGRVVIEVKDNGGGVDREKVLAAAIRKGLVPENATLAPADVDRLLFAPGFSTASAVTNLSGRGVGMDVVNNEIKRLGGRVAIISTPGEGTTISISLPLTLAVLDGMIVDVAGQIMVVPISAIVETLRPDPANIRLIGPSARTITLRDSVIPVIDLCAVFGFERRAPLEQKGVLLLVEDEKGECRGLSVDRILDQRQVVIKSLEENFGHVPFVAAATILGNGQIALIVDVDEIIHDRAQAVPVVAPHSLGVPA